MYHRASQKNRVPYANLRRTYDTDARSSMTRFPAVSIHRSSAFCLRLSPCQIQHNRPPSVLHQMRALNAAIAFLVCALTRCTRSWMHSPAPDAVCKSPVSSLLGPRPPPPRANLNHMSALSALFAAYLCALSLGGMSLGGCTHPRLAIWRDSARAARASPNVFALSSP